ncbi:hypothetical protein U1Q18_046315 [Sarracenia purpurea var. burkii]
MEPSSTPQQPVHHARRHPVVHDLEEPPHPHRLLNLAHDLHPLPAVHPGEVDDEDVEVLGADQVVILV